MPVRAWVTAAVALLAPIGGVAAETTSTGWHVEIPAPRRGLPALDIHIGYRSDYVPSPNSPIEMKAQTVSPFDGYLGFRFAVGRAFTRDIPILSRAEIQPGKAWSFLTTVQLANTGDGQATRNRELVVEWRDRSFNILARRNVGRIPWTEIRPLRIASQREPRLPQRYLGFDAVVFADSECSDRAQWYAGFSAVIVPVELWLDLPDSTRQAIFHSGTYVVFFGTPRAGQRLSTSDQVHLPVRFSPGAGIVEIPALYRRDKSTHRPAQFSWRAANGEGPVIGGETRPYIVGSPLAAYAAEEEAIREPLPTARPVMLVIENVRLAKGFPLTILQWPNPLLPVTLALVLVPTVWLSLKRKGDLRVIAIALIGAVVILGLRNWSRPVEGTHITEHWQTIKPGIVRHSWTEVKYGRSPLAASSIPPAEARSLTARRGQVQEDAEVRTSETLPGHGLVLYERSAWDSTSRSRQRVELGVTPSIRVIETSPDRLVFDYRLPFAAREVIAVWTANGRTNGGQLRLSEPEGRATISAVSLRSKTLQPLSSLIFAPRLFRSGRNERVDLTFVDDRPPWHTRVIEWEGSGGASPSFVAYSIGGLATATGKQEFSGIYRLPDDAFPPRGIVTVVVAPDFPAAGVEVTGELGKFTLTREPTMAHQQSRFSATVADLARVAKPGQLIRVRVTSSAARTDPTVGIGLRMRGTES